MSSSTHACNAQRSPGYPRLLLSSKVRISFTPTFYICLFSLSRAGRISYYPQEELQQLKPLEDLVPEVDINEACPQFHNLNILGLAVVLGKREMFEILVQLEADLDFVLPSGKSVRQVAENYAFDLAPSLTNESCDSEKSRKRKKHLPILKKLGNFLFKKHH